MTHQDQAILRPNLIWKHIMLTHHNQAIVSLNLIWKHIMLAHQNEAIVRLGAPSNWVCVQVYVEYTFIEYAFKYTSSILSLNMRSGIRRVYFH